MLICRNVSVLWGVCCFFFFKQKTAYEMRISDWSSDVCSSDLDALAVALPDHGICLPDPINAAVPATLSLACWRAPFDGGGMQDMLDSMRDQVMRHADSPYYETPIPRVIVAPQCAPSSGVPPLDRRSVGEGKGVSVRVGTGGR